MSVVSTSPSCATSISRNDILRFGAVETADPSKEDLRGISDFSQAPEAPPPPDWSRHGAVSLPCRRGAEHHVDENELEPVAFDRSPADRGPRGAGADRNAPHPRRGVRPEGRGGARLRRA